MKKITMLCFAAAAISLASCKKDQTCTCTGTFSDRETQSVNGTVQAGFPITTTSDVSYSDLYKSTTPAAGRANCMNQTITSTMQKLIDCV